jgi:hypothetical protein
MPKKAQTHKHSKNDSSTSALDYRLNNTKKSTKHKNCVNTTLLKLKHTTEAIAQKADKRDL